MFYMQAVYTLLMKTKALKDRELIDFVKQYTGRMIIPYNRSKLHKIRRIIIAVPVEYFPINGMTFKQYIRGIVRKIR